jgi:hypothetical protein
MPIYLGSPVSNCDEIRLERWSIREVSTGEQYFVGFDVIMRDGRMGTAIVSFDPRTRIGVTSSGRRYRLLGRAAFDKDAEYVWNRVIEIRDIKDWKDVTPDLCPDWRDSIPEAERIAAGSEPQIGDGHAGDESGRADSWYKPASDLRDATLWSTIFKKTDTRT